MKYLIHILSVLLILMSCQSAARYSRIKQERQKQNVPLEQQEKIHTGNYDEFVNNWLGTPYRFGGLSKNGVDCSGLTIIFYLTFFKKELPRTAEDQFIAGEKIIRSSLLAGDLVFFKDARGYNIDHVGIYLGNDRFIHASESNGVVISEMQEEYYARRFAGACRY